MHPPKKLLKIGAGVLTLAATTILAIIGGKTVLAFFSETRNMKSWKPHGKKFALISAILIRTAIIVLTAQRRWKLSTEKCGKEPGAMKNLTRQVTTVNMAGIYPAIIARCEYTCSDGQSHSIQNNKIDSVIGCVTEERSLKTTTALRNLLLAETLVHSVHKATDLTSNLFCRVGIRFDGLGSQFVTSDDAADL